MGARTVVAWAQRSSAQQSLGSVSTRKLAPATPSNTRFPAAPGAPDDPPPGGPAPGCEVKPIAPMSRMQRLRPVFDIDPSYCPRCGAQRGVIAAITEPALIATVLQHLAMRDEHGRGARAPPNHLPLQSSPPQ